MGGGALLLERTFKTPSQTNLPTKQNPMSGRRQPRGRRACIATTKSLPCHTHQTTAALKTPGSTPCRRARASPFHSSGAFWCSLAASTAWHRANFQSMLFPGTKHCLTAPQTHPSVNELTYHTQRQKWQHCAAHNGFS